MHFGLILFFIGLALVLYFFCDREVSWNSSTNVIPILFYLIFALAVAIGKQNDDAERQRHEIAVKECSEKYSSSNDSFKLDMCLKMEDMNVRSKETKNAAQSAQAMSAMSMMIGMGRR